jgi:lysophospholipase L1-like esterase
MNLNASRILCSPGALDAAVRLKRMPPLRVILPILLLFGLASASLAQRAGKASLAPTIKRVIFLGDSITYLGQYTADVEAYFATRYPGEQISFINVGLPSETVSGLSEPGHAGGAFPRPVLKERLDRVLEATKPDLVFACYGMNDGIYLPFDETRFTVFQNGIRALHEAVTQAGAKIVHLTPPFFDGLQANNPAYQETLARYSQWLLAQRDEPTHWHVVDVNGPMTAFVEEKRRTEPRYALAADSVHPNDLGHWLIAKQILLFLGATDLTTAAEPSQMFAGYPNGEKIYALVRQREDLLKDAWLTATKHKRPGMNTGLPLPEASQKAAEIQRQIEALAKAP